MKDHSHIIKVRTRLNLLQTSGCWVILAYMTHHRGGRKLRQSEGPLESEHLCFIVIINTVGWRRPVSFVGGMVKATAVMMQQIRNGGISLDFADLIK